MYKQRRFNVTTVLMLGVLAGVIFLIYDNILTPSSVPSQVSLLSTATIAPPSGDSAAPDPTATHAARGIVSDATIFIPSAGVLSPIVQVFLDGESWDVSRLGKNVGHLQGTSWLDASGNVVLSGHVENADGTRGVFAALKDLDRGETIIVTYQGVERRYVVTDSHYVEPDDLTPVYPTSSDRLTLITCDSYDFFQDTYLQRMVVVAERVQ